MNKEIRLLQDELIQTLNNSRVEIEVKRLIVTNILDLIKKEADAAIIEELEAEKKASETTE